MAATLSDILLLGDPRLTEVCQPVRQEEVDDLADSIDKMAHLVLLFRKTYGAGRAIAAPQIGLMKRMVVMNIEQPQVLLNPVIVDRSRELFRLWDDCMSFPNLLVRVDRHRSCTLRFRDTDWQECQWALEGDLAELLQHELDHLDGILAIDRAVGEHPFRWRSTPDEAGLTGGTA